MRLFTLAEEGISEGIRCSSHGAVVGGVPLLRRISGPGGATRWLPRDTAELDAELSERYALPVDFAAKADGLATIAQALNDGNVALAQIATLHLRLPDPPMAKSFTSLEAAIALATELYRAGILKGDWDPSKHPRTGAPPNPGWFAEVPKEPKVPAPGWPSRGVNMLIRDQARRLAAAITERGSLVLTGPVGDAIVGFLDAFSPTELNRGEDRAIAQFKSYFDPPKTLQELQLPNPDKLGYERHHIVEQNPGNRAKFGDLAIDDPSNIVYIPRLKHEEISAYYNSKPDGASSDETFRDSIADLDFQAQRQEGLAALRNVGVLK